MLGRACCYVVLAVGLASPVRALPPALGHSSPPAATPREIGGSPLSFDDRVRYQRRIEEVYWRHRIWPAANPGPKPALDQVLSETTIRRRVTSDLEKSAALAEIWSRPLTGEQLQAEIDRMVRNTKNPDLLQELFAALDDEPSLIAECLARPVLADRLVRNWYARDNRFHGVLRQQAAQALESHPYDVSRMADAGGSYAETTWRRASMEPEIVPRERDAPGSIGLTPEEWRQRVGRLAALYGPGDPSRDDSDASLLQALPLNRPSRLVEQNDRFVVTVVLSKQADRLRTATVTWNKRSFDSWWAEEGRPRIESTAGAETRPVPPPAGGYAVQTRLGGGCTADTWTALPYVASARYGHTAVWTGAEMIVWGGFGSGPQNTGGRYDPATDSWTVTSTTNGVPFGSIWHTAVWTGTEMIVWGGAFGSYNLNTGGRYDPLTDSWTATSTGTGVPQARFNHSAVWTGTEMIVWGGGTLFTHLSTGGRYDPSTDSWTPTSFAGHPGARSWHTAVWTGTEMIVWGGSDGNRLNTGGRYDPVTDSWALTSTGAGVPEARWYHTAVWTGTEMIVWGGQNNVDLFSGARYDPATDAWTATSSASGVPDPRKWHAAVWTGTEMIVWGGDSNGLFLVTGGRYDPVADSWTGMSTSGGLPEGRRFLTAVWTGTEMIAWGGETSTGPLNTGGRYDPLSDSWTATSTGPGIPVARNGHTATWTGAEMIVWGGEGEAYTQLNSGGRYDPATDAWTATSTGTGVPAERWWHTAVWDGTEMIVWGGQGDGYLNTGGRYDPTTDSWTATSTGAGVPEGRRVATAVWTGKEMIVWGGGIASGVLNSGGRYDPAADTWVETSVLAGVPQARYFHSAVWTGKEMIVWGGSDDVTYMDNGARYDPATDTWSPTSAGAGTPAPRYAHTAVWTGSEMIVWGGSDDVTYLDNGARYDPVNDTWIAVSNGAGAPQGRFLHTAVWTGKEMIVWGGYGGAFEDSGAGYDPAADAWSPTSSANAPGPRAWHGAVWTGTDMIVWGGATDGALNSGARYCACAGGAVALWYPDADADGFGVTSAAVPSCEQPPGYVAAGGDCDDTAASCIANCAADADSDGIHDCADTCIDVDGDGYGAPGGAGFTCIAADCDDGFATCTVDCTSDADGDATPDCSDNCPVYNPSQLDADGDGWGVAVGCDCDDSIPETYPGASEINDGLDNQCPGEDGYGIADEIDPDIGFLDPSNNKNRLVWTAQPGAAEYLVARSTSPDFSIGCTTFIAPNTWFDDAAIPAPGSTYHYLVSTLLPFGGSWGRDSTPAERHFVCGTETLCDNGGDEDSDGQADCLDLDCDAVGFCEFGGELTCNDGQDNDGDTLADCLDDECDTIDGCEFGGELTCNDGQDNDGDTLADCLDDECDGIDGCELGTEVTCNDAIDNDGDTLADCLDDDCDGIDGCELGTEMTCDDGIDNDGDGDTDCDDSNCLSVCLSTFGFTDTAGNDITMGSLQTFFGSRPSDPNDYILFEIQRPEGRFAWCSERADFYRDTYLANATGNAVVSSGMWNKWTWNDNVSSQWVSEGTAGHENRYGTDCGETYSWCSEKLGGQFFMNLSVRSARADACEASTFGNNGAARDCSDGTWTLNIRVADTRLLACGF